MASLGTMKIRYEFEEIVKLECLSMDCINHMNNEIFCNLKKIDIGSDGKCESYFSKPK